MVDTLTLWCLQAIQVDSPPPFTPTSGDLSRHNNLELSPVYAWTSHSAIDINVHTHIGVCQTYNIAFE